jgi:opacity protein-like surface antigen
MKKFIALSVLAFATAANAQNNDPAKGKLDVFSTVGVSKVHENYKPASGKSIQTTTGVELRLSRPSSVGLALSFDSYGYKKSGTSYHLDGSLKATALSLFYRYKFGTGNLQPYLKAGGGTAWLSLPTVDVKQTTIIKKEVQNVGLALAELGVQVRILPRYSLLIGTESKWMSKSSLAENTSLRTLGFKLGLISAF